MFEPSKYIVSFSIILSANVRSGIISLAWAVQIVINIKQISQENNKQNWT